MDANQVRVDPSPNSEVLSDSLIDLNFEITFTRMIGFKDQATLQHSNRVAEITAEWISYQRSKQKWMEFNTSELIRAARLHDIGKIGILDQVLQKPGILTPEEKTHLNLHSEIGYELVRDIPSQTRVAEAVRHHHERWDGQGYPLGLKEDQIPVFAQIIAIVDAYDAMTSERPYQKARTREEAGREIEECAGRHFSPSFSQDFVQFLHARNS